jgi:hypothetical protein
MLPLNTVAANFVPSADIVIEFQLLIDPTELSSDQSVPLLLEIHMFPLSAAAASFVPSADIVIALHFFTSATEISSIHIAADPLYIFSNMTRHIDKIE